MDPPSSPLPSSIFSPACHPDIKYDIRVTIYHTLVFIHSVFTSLLLFIFNPFQYSKPSFLSFFHSSMLSFCFPFFHSCMLSFCFPFFHSCILSFSFPFFQSRMLSFSFPFFQSCMLSFSFPFFQSFMLSYSLPSFLCCLLGLILGFH